MTEQIDVLEALEAGLYNGRAGSLVGGRVYADQMPQRGDDPASAADDSDAYPAIIASQQAGRADTPIGGTASGFLPTWNVKVVGEGESFAALRPVAAAVVEDLHKKTFTTASGASITPRFQRSLLVPVTANGVRYVQIVGLFSIDIKP